MPWLPLLTRGINISPVLAIARAADLRDLPPSCRLSVPHGCLPLPRHRLRPALILCAAALAPSHSPTPTRPSQAARRQRLVSPPENQALRQAQTEPPPTMIFTIGFVFWRFAEILTLIPIVGMLAYFVNGYVNANVLTPDYILILFIVSVLALAWAIFTLFLYHRSSNNAKFVALIDIGTLVPSRSPQTTRANQSSPPRPAGFVGAFIAGVYYLRFIANANCTSIAPGSTYDIDFGIFGSFSGNGVDIDTNKTCALLKASFAFGIMNCIFFFFTAVLAWFHGDRMSRDRRSSKRYYRETHYSRRGHRARRSSHGSHGSRRSSHSHRRVYV